MLNLQQRYESKRQIEQIRHSQIVALEGRGPDLQHHVARRLQADEALHQVEDGAVSALNAGEFLHRDEVGLEEGEEGVVGEVRRSEPRGVLVDRPAVLADGVQDRCGGREDKKARDAPDRE